MTQEKSTDSEWIRALRGKGAVCDFCCRRHPRQAFAVKVCQLDLEWYVNETPEGI